MGSNIIQYVRKQHNTTPRIRPDMPCRSLSIPFIIHQSSKYMHCLFLVEIVNIIYYDVFFKIPHLITLLISF